MKKILSMLLIIAMVFSLSLTAFAEDEGVTYYCDNGDIAEKFQIPNKARARLTAWLATEARTIRGHL